MELNWAAIIVAFISLLVSIWAIKVSKRANRLAETKFEREKNIEKPILFNTYVDTEDRFVFVIEDYSNNKNLRIDKVEVITPQRKDYMEIDFDTNYNDAANPPQMVVVTKDSFNPLEAYTFKIYTNFNAILEYNHGTIFSEDKPKN